MYVELPGPYEDSLRILGSVETGVKQWQNFQALCKVKACIEQQISDVASTLESSLDQEELILLSPEQYSHGMTNLARIAGVLHMMEYHEIALLVVEIHGLLEDSVALRLEQDGQRITEMRQLAFVVLTDFPAILDGVLSGQIRHWHEFSQIFNRIRKARNRSLVFSSQTLFVKQNVNFRKVFASNPEHMKALLHQQLKRYNKIKRQLHENRSVSESVREFHAVFSSLEVMCRDFRLATLWGLCAALAEALPEDQASLDNSSVKLLCSFSSIMQMVRDMGARALDRNIPEDMLGKLMEALSRPHLETGRTLAISYWFNLDFRLSKSWRKSNQELLVSYNRKDAFAKAIKLLTERTGQLSDQINDEIANDSPSQEQVARYTSEFRILQASVATLGMGPLVELLGACADSAPVQTDADAPLPGAAVMEYTVRCAQTLYKCELFLQRHAEELERAVFVSQAGKNNGAAFTGVQLSVVLEAIKNLEQVVIGINNYVEAGWDSGKLADVSRLLHGAGAALMAVPVANASGFCAVAGKFVEVSLDGAERPDQDPELDNALHAFAHLIISSILYLEQVSIGRNENCARLELECNAYLEILRLATTPVVAADTDDMPAGDDIGLASDTGHDVPETGSAQGNPAIVEDDEIQAVFVEEAGELLLQIDGCHALLTRQPDDAEALLSLRRSYHTLKGSGRMVGAEAVAALAWSVENLLNNVNSGRLQSGTVMLDALTQIRVRLPALVADFQGRIPSAFDADSVADDIAGIDSFLAGDTPAAAVQAAEAGADVVADAAAEALPETAAPEILAQEFAGEDSGAQETGQIEVQAAGQPVDVGLHCEAGPSDRESDDAGVTAEEITAVPELAGTATDSLWQIFEDESRRKISCIRQYLDGSVSVDGDGQTITSTSYLIPVHTLYGNCRAAELEQFGIVVGQLERLLEDHPYRQVSSGLHALLASFCDITETVTRNPGTGSAFLPAAELPREFAAFLLALSDVRNELSGTCRVDDGDGDETGLTGDRTDAAPLEANEVLLLKGFLQEARTISARIGNLYTAFTQDGGYDRELARRLQDQFALFEEAAGLAEQRAMAAVCRELAQAYQQYADGLYAVNETVISLLDRCHGYVKASLTRLESGARVETLAEDLQTELKLAIGQLISLRKDANIQVAEEKVEDSLLAVFIEEAGEILHELDSKIADWQQAPDDRTIIDDLLRSLHTLKGSAALVGEKDMSVSAHNFETCVIDAGNSRRNRDAGFFAEVDRHLNVLQMLFALYHTDESGRPLRSPMAIEALEKLMQVDAAHNTMDDVAAATQISSAVTAEPEQRDGLPGVVAALPAAHDNGTHADSTAISAHNGIAPGAGLPPRVAIDEHVRVSANLLKSLLNDADEISIARNRVEQTIADLQNLMGDMEETLGRFDNSMNSFEHYAKTGAGLRQQGESGGNAQDKVSENAAARDFDALEMDKYTELQQIVLSLLEDYNDVMDIKNNVSGKLRTMATTLVEQQRSTNKLQEGLVSSQMVPFAGVAPRLRRLVRQVSTELDKQVTISFGNPEGKIDRSVLQALVNPIEHMIRNAIDHGIESTLERLASGKQGQGELLVKLFRQGASIILEIADDGRGINTAKVRQKAIAQGLLAEDAELAEQELCQFILRAGFSTSDTVSRISGRGVGLDVVQDEISQIGGDIEIISAPGLGTTFRIRLPLTSSLNRALLFTVSGVEYVMLLNTIDGIVLQKNDALQRCHDADEPSLVQYGDKSYELAYLGSLLDERAVPELQGGKDASSSLVLVSGAAKNLALHVDSVIGSRELVVKSLGAQFSSIPVLTGGVILGDGRVVVVLDPRFLVDSHVAKKRDVPRPEGAYRNEAAASADSNEEPAGEFKTGKTVMVVDDSITVRKVTSAILKRNGMNVILAKNGVEAVELLRTTRPDIMLLDIEMPRMDGFEVAAYVRRQENDIRDLPIIMITSRIGEKHRSRAEEIGVNQYMCKPFQEVNLLEAIAGYN